jgi:formiminotetrahydrofolate cyclodeaminase
MGSIWPVPLGELRERVAGTDPVPAGVAISAVTASLALALLSKVLEINRKRKSFDGDPRQLDALLENVRRESVHLTELADADVQAFDRYMELARRKQPTDEAMREAIRVPMDAARAAAKGLDLCQDAAPHCQTGMTASDFAVAGALLSGALRGMILSIESNLKYVAEDDNFRMAILAELPNLRSRLQ